jgi:hypothetical protein
MGGYTPILNKYTVLDPHAYMVQADAQFQSLWAEIGSIEGSEAIPSNTNPTMAGVAAPGVLASYARGDHVHPSDTSRVNKAGDTMTGVLAFSQSPTAPTPATADNSTNVATTAYVKAQGYAPLASPALTGTPTAPTPTAGDNSTKLATAAFVTGGFLPKTGGTLTGLFVLGYASPAMWLNAAAAGQSRGIVGLTNGSQRWKMELGNITAEGGSNAGSDFWITRYSDAGSQIDIPLQFNRATAQFTITGAPYCPGGGAWNASSDARIKNVSGPYQRGLTEIAQLRPVTFTYKGNDTTEAPAEDDTAAPYHGSPHYHAATTSTQYAGLIAQELEAVMPELVTQRSGHIDGQAVADMRDFNQGPLIFALINAVQELLKRVQTLEAAQGAP